MTSTRADLALAAFVALVTLACSSDDTPSDLDAGAAGDGAIAADAPPADALTDAAITSEVDGGLPDLIVDLDRARADLAVRTETFAIDSCELDPDEACVDASGARRLLHFSVETPNIGTADLHLGPPDDDNPNFAYSSCHNHYHFEGYAEYRLLDAESNQVATGRKQAFCLLDTARYVPAGPGIPNSREYDCENQGIQRGWSDVYYSSLPCQFIDITDVPDGDYSLEISINNSGILEESNLENNVVAVPVAIGSPDLEGPTEPCAEGASTHATDDFNRECGWNDGGVLPCVPEVEYHIGCAANCDDLGSCTGDAMMRVCDGAMPDGNCSFPGSIDESDDSCASQCPAVTFVECPASGEFAVYWAPFRVGADATCTIEMRPAAD